MTAINTSDEELKDTLFNNDKAIVFYYKKNHEPCKKLLADFDELSKNHIYNSIAFLIINAEESYLAQRLAKQIPFISTYQNGLLIECKSISDKEDLVEMLNELKKERINY